MTNSKHKFSFDTIISKSNRLDIGIVIILFFATLIINSRMIKEGLNGLGDMRWHLTWIQHFSKQLSEGIWYPRWLAGTNYGYGSPTFVFYPPLAYYLASFLKNLGFNIEQTFSWMCSIAVFLCGFFFYIYGKDKFGKIPALIGALSYMLCPGMFYLLNGGALTSLMALAWIPLGVYITEKAIANYKWQISVSILWFLIALTHAPSFLLYLVTWLFYLCFLFFVVGKNRKNIIKAMIFGGLGIGSASFYLLPAMIEQQNINIAYMLASQSGFIAQNIATFIPQTFFLLFNNSQIIQQQSLQILFFTSIALIGFRKNSRLFRFTLYAFLFVLIIIFFISDWSLVVWHLSKTLQKIENSWRIGSLLYFGQAILCSLAVKSIVQKPALEMDYKSYFIKMLLVFMLIMFLLSNFSFGYSLSHSMPTLDNQGRGRIPLKEWIETIIHDPYSNRLIDVPEYRTKLDNSNPTFYLNETYTDSGLVKITQRSLNSPISPLPTPLVNQPEVFVIKGDADYNIKKWYSYHREIELKVKERSTIRLRTYYYPAWHILINNKPYPMEKGDDGTINVTLSPGEYTLILKYEKTLAYKLGIILSILCFIISITFAIIQSKRLSHLKRNPSVSLN